MERASKRQRQMSTDNESDSEGNDDWSPENNGLGVARRLGSSSDAGGASRSRRAVAGNPLPEQTKRSIRLNVKAPSKLRNVIEPDPPRRKRASLARSSKSRKPVYTGFDQSGDEDEEDDEMDEDAEAEHDQDEEDDNERGDDHQLVEDSDQASADEISVNQSEDDDERDIDEDGDESMADAPTPVHIPTIKLKPQPKAITAISRPRKESPRRMLARHGKLKSVEEKEMEMSTRDNTEDEDLSELASQRIGEEEDEEEDEEEEEEDEEEMEEVELEDDEEEEEEEASEDDEDEEDGGQNLQNDTLDTIRASGMGEGELSDSDVSTSRAATPDPNKLTRRQRGTDDTSLMALSNEAQKKKFFTAEQITMRKAEMARRRKDLSEKRNEEEKADTLNRLLHKQAPKRRTRAQIMADAEREEFGTPGAEDGEYPKPRPTYVRTIHSLKGTRVGVPEEWLGKPVGAVFDGLVPPQSELKSQGGSRMVQVID